MKKNLGKLISCVLLVCLIWGLGLSGGKTRAVDAAVNFKIHYIDVGQADAALLQYGEGSSAKYALIDAGARTYHKTSDPAYAKKEFPAYEYLKKHNIDCLEFVLITHPHQDHIGGMEKILDAAINEEIEIKKIYGNDLNLQYLETGVEGEAQETAETHWTTVDTEVFKTFQGKLEEYCQKIGKNVDEVYEIPFPKPEVR